MFFVINQFLTVNHNIVLLAYNDIGISDTPFITSDVLCYQSIPVNHNIVLLAYNDIGISDTPSITSDVVCYQSVPHC